MQQNRNFLQLELNIKKCEFIKPIDYKDTRIKENLLEHEKQDRNGTFFENSNGWKPLTFFAKLSISDVWQGSSTPLENALENKWSANLTRELWIDKNSEQNSRRNSFEKVVLRVNSVNVFLQLFFGTHRRGHRRCS